MLDTHDIVTIGPAARALVREIAEALSEDGDGGKAITKAEGLRILKLAGKLLVTLIADLID